MVNDHGEKANGHGTGAPTQSAHVCVARSVPNRDITKAAEFAIAENPENAPGPATMQAERRVGVGAASTLETFGAVLTGKKWKPGRKLRVRHLDGDTALHARVEQAAKEWERHANLTFHFVDDAAEIRISYHLDGNSWSYIGTDALSIAEPDETMHYGWLSSGTDDQELRRVVLHEFGHAIGMIHEQSQPDSPIEWDKPAVYRHYAGMGWSKAQVDSNVFEHYSKAQTQFSEYDKSSIMHYPVPEEFTINAVSVGMNTELSRKDKDFIARIYPGSSGASTPAQPAMASPHEAAASNKIEITLT